MNTVGDSSKPHGFRRCEICKVQQKPNSGVFLARFPLDTDICHLWVKAVGDEDLLHIPTEQLHKNKYICGNHFTDQDFAKNKKRLRKAVVPTIALLKSPLEDELLIHFPPNIEIYPTQRMIEPFKDITNISTQQLSTSMQSNDGTTSTTTAQPEASTSYALNEVASNKSNESEESTSKNINVCAYQRRSKNKSDSDKKQCSRRENKLIQKLLKSNITLKKLAKSKVDLDDLESSVLKNIVQNALNNQSKNPQGKRWDFYNKISALAIYKRSPKAYRYLQKVIPLPSTKTLDRLLENLSMQPGINIKILNVLKDKLNQMDHTDRFCALLFDEMALKKRLIFNEGIDMIEGYEDLGAMGRFDKIANKALVFLIQGLKRKYKQPVAFYFVNGTISKENLLIIIKDVIMHLEQAGLKVVATVCDQGPTNIGALNLLKRENNINPSENYFFANNSKKYIIFDAPHLLKSFRNNFYNAGEIQFDGKIGKWKHLLEAEERNRNFLNFKKINNTVVRPTYKTKMRVKYAAQALSNTMAAVIKMLSWKNNNVEYLDTAEIVEKFDKLFDSINGPASPKDVKKGIRENVSAKSFHFKTWATYLECIDTIKFLKSDSKIHLKNVRCILGLKITLKSLINICDFLFKNGFKYVNLRQLNQDALENLFGVIRQHGITNKNPTCSHFVAALKSSIISGATAPHSRGSNCEEDCSKLFLGYSDISENKKGPKEMFEMAVTENTYPVLSLPDTIQEIECDFETFENQPIVYVSGYVAAKLFKKHTCEICAQYLIVKNPTEDLYKYIELREWWHDKKSLTYPTKNLCDTVNQTKIIFENNVVPNIFKENISEFCKLQFMVSIDMGWFKCLSHYNYVTSTIFKFLSYLYIRKYCKIENQKFILSENVASDRSKLAQQESQDK